MMATGMENFESGNLINCVKALDFLHYGLKTSKLLSIPVTELPEAPIGAAGVLLSS